MNATEHYQKSVELLEAAHDAYVLDDNVEEHNLRVAAAQVHATLALSCTVATALMPLAEAAARQHIAGTN